MNQSQQIMGMLEANDMVKARAKKMIRQAGSPAGGISKVMSIIQGVLKSVGADVQVLDGGDEIGILGKDKALKMAQRVLAKVGNLKKTSTEPDPQSGMTAIWYKIT